MLYSPEDNIVEVKPNLKKELQFYRLKIAEKTNSNGVIIREEIIKNLHLTIRKTVSNGYEYHVEVFDRLHRNRELSLSEKDLIDQIATITDDVKVMVDENLNFVKIVNYNLIKRKAKEKIKMLSKKYVGVNASKLFDKLEQFYKNENLLYKDLQRYDKYGLVLIKFLGYYRFGLKQKYKVRYTNFLKNTWLEINEDIKMNRLNRAIEEVELTLTGEINLENFNKKMFEREMKVQNIYFDETEDRPKLDKYEGTFVFNTKTGMLNKSEVIIAFSFGKNYSKDFHYQLTSVKHDEI
ncbi:hypothetical protein ACFSX9_01375 [Flavobacterium ardleyense]|uniref:Uncharacterized protein n=1 Tax=Flavobacterium ardleyense TaxID=2038737 RepID=A0ABW5Z412_9FLAO